MELNYYRLTFSNNQEFMIESKYDIDGFLKDLHSGFFKDTKYISLRLKDGEPLNLREHQLFSVQKISKTLIGNQTRIWRIA